MTYVILGVAIWTIFGAMVAQDVFDWDRKGCSKWRMAVQSVLLGPFVFAAVAGCLVGCLIVACLEGDGESERSMSEGEEMP